MILRSWVEIDLAALRHNLGVAAGSGRNVIAVIKANAYGHGAVRVAEALEGEPNLTAFGVATLSEAIELQNAGASVPLLILGTALGSEREEIANRGFWVSISSIEEAAAFDSLGQKLGQQIPAHVVVDTGMGRMGFRETDFDARTASALIEFENLDFIGLASHFPSADEDPEFTRQQIAKFRSVVDIARAAGLGPRFIHLANSAGILGFNGAPAETTTARPGLMLYGVSPLPEFQSRLRPALTLKTHVTLIRDLPAGHGISYGRTFVTEKPTKVATLAIGYGDGVIRHLSGHGAEILIGGTRCPLLGRVTMDQIMADVGALDHVQPGDEAVLIGKQGGCEITASEVAEKAGTIPWEVFTSITDRVQRVYLNH